MMRAAALLCVGVAGAAGYSLRSSAAAGGYAFDYAHHGSDWLQGICSDHERQSPVDFEILDTVPTGRLHYNYGLVSDEFVMTNNGHTFSADMSKMGYGGLTYEENWYNLVTVNFHSLSEHTFKGMHYPIEAHLVHKKFDSDDLIIVAVPFTSSNQTFAAALIEERRSGKRVSLKTQQPYVERDVLPVTPEYGASPMHYMQPDNKDEHFNPQLQHFMRFALPLVGQKGVGYVTKKKPLDLNQFLEGGIYFEYGGSLTAPPCSTNVIWLVRRNPLLASEAQVRILSDNIFQMTADFGNYREVLPINGRPVATRDSVREEAPPEPDLPELPIGSFPRTDREFQAMKWARDALRVAKTSSDYVNKLDNRLQRASTAHVNALVPELHLVPTAPPKVIVKEMSQTDMARTAATLAKAVAQAAKEAIKEATDKISAEAERAAREAAEEAAKEASKHIRIVEPKGAPGPSAAPADAPIGAPFAMPAPAPAPQRPPAAAFF